MGRSASGFSDKIVIDVPSSGPHTYENRRQIGRSLTVNYHDFFRDELARRGVAYFSYSTRYTAPARAQNGRAVGPGQAVRICRVVGTQFYVVPC